MIQNIRKITFFMILALCNISNGFTYQHEISAVLIFKDEGPYLKEWIEYHKLIGVEHFYLYNNGSTDNYRRILDPYIKSREVELFNASYFSPHLRKFDAIQRNAYKDAIKRSKDKTKWLLVIDSDEFVVPVKSYKLNTFLKGYENESIGGVYLWWVWFGTSNVPRIPSNRLLIETLQLNKGHIGAGKSLIRPDRVRNVINPHKCSYMKNYVCKEISYTRAQINHYWFRDEYYAYKHKWPRRKNWGLSYDNFKSMIDGANKKNQQYFKPITKYIKPLRAKIFPAKPLAQKDEIQKKQNRKDRRRSGRR